MSEEAPVDELTGRIGRFRIVEHLGSGGMGQVYHGVDETLRRPVAVKVLKHRLRKGSSRRARLLHEARVLSQLHTIPASARSTTSSKATTTTTSCWS